MTKKKDFSRSFVHGNDPPVSSPPVVGRIEQLTDDCDSLDDWNRLQASKIIKEIRKMEEGNITPMPAINDRSLTSVLARLDRAERLLMSACNSKAVFKEMTPQSQKLFVSLVDDIDSRDRESESKDGYD